MRYTSFFAGAAVFLAASSAALPAHSSSEKPESRSISSHSRHPESRSVSSHSRHHRPTRTTSGGPQPTGSNKPGDEPCDDDNHKHGGSRWPWTGNAEYEINHWPAKGGKSCLKDTDCPDKQFCRPMIACAELVAECKGQCVPKPSGMPSASSMPPPRMPIPTESGHVTVPSSAPSSVVTPAPSSSASE